MKPILKVFVTENCPGCDEACNIAVRIERKYPAMIVEVINITDAQVIVPEAVFATPTYMLNGQIVSLGNPSPDDIIQWLGEPSTIQPET